MAKSNRCSVCQKEIGAIFCTGCTTHFCTKDFKDHQEKLSNDLDGIIQERDELQETINKAVEAPIASSPLILEIDKWKENMIQKVEQVAGQARERLTELLNAKKTQISIELDAFSEELAHQKESKNFFEPDLIRLRQLVRQFNEELKQIARPVTIELVTKDSDHIEWIRLISIEVKANPTIYQAQQKPAAQQPAKSTPQKGLRKEDSTA